MLKNKYLCIYFFFLWSLVLLPACGNLIVVPISHSPLISTSSVVSLALALALALAAIPPWIGTRQLGVSSSDTQAYSEATDLVGNIFVAGSTAGNLDGNILTGTSDFFVTKYNSSGTKQWTKQLGVSGVGTQAFGVATDSVGNVFVTGRTYGGLDGNTLTGSADFFVTKYDSSGIKQWTKQLGVSSTWAMGIATDSVGNIFVAGRTFGGLDGNTLTGISDFFVTKYNSSGTKQWTKQLGASGSTTGAYGGVKTDSAGNIFVAGYTTGNLDGNILTGYSDFFVTKYDSSGTKQWTKQLGASGAADIQARGVATDSAGNIFVTGYTNGNLDGNTLTGLNDFFVTKYDTSGTKQWTRQMGAVGRATGGSAVATDVIGNIFVTGYTGDGLDGNVLTGNEDLFITKYNSNGTKQWTKQLGASAASTDSTGLVTDSAGNIFVAGYTNGNLDGNTLIGTKDFFVTKYDASGVKQ